MEADIAKYFVDIYLNPSFIDDETIAEFLEERKTSLETLNENFLRQLDKIEAEKKLKKGIERQKTVDKIIEKIKQIKLEGNLNSAENILFAYRQKESSDTSEDIADAQLLKLIEDELGNNT